MYNNLTQRYVAQNQSYIFIHVCHPNYVVTLPEMLSYVARSYNRECMCYRSKLNSGEVF